MQEERTSIKLVKGDEHAPLHKPLLSTRAMLFRGPFRWAHQVNEALQDLPSPALKDSDIHVPVLATIPVHVWSVR
jgi:hypothetical protein